jgi:hypothetical protein
MEPREVSTCKLFFILMEISPPEHKYFKTSGVFVIANVSISIVKHNFLNKNCKNHGPQQKNYINDSDA